MHFSYFKQISSKIKKNELPGLDAQLILAPDFRRKSLQHHYDLDKAKKAGVLILFYPDENGLTHFVLILRKSYKGVHSGQVALPGGKLEKKDRDLIETALRETEEEIGVDSSFVEVLKPLTELYIPPSDFLVKPTLAMIDHLPVFKKEAKEVEEIIQVSVKDFMKLEPGIVTINTSYAKNKEVMSFPINGYVVWGATAMILSELQVLLKNTIDV
jgi:8-oxo-dGTP pyrophosphatase MutT (NUDIX family)